MFESQIFMCKNFRYDANRFEWLAGGIHALFPSFTKEEFHVKGTQGNNPRGLLYHKYKKNRCIANKLGLVVKKRTKKDLKGTVKLDSAIFDAVRTCSGDIDKDFLSAWSEVYLQRRKVFKTSPIVDILKKFPCLSKEDGYKLVVSIVF